MDRILLIRLPGPLYMFIGVIGHAVNCSTPQPLDPADAVEYGHLLRHIVDERTKIQTTGIADLDTDPVFLALTAPEPQPVPLAAAPGEATTPMRARG